MPAPLDVDRERKAAAPDDKLSMKEVRAQLGWSRMELGLALGCSSHTIDSIESGRLAISPKMSIKLHALLCYDLDAFIEEQVCEYREELNNELRNSRSWIIRRLGPAMRTR